MGKRTALVALLIAVTATALAACIPAPTVTLKITPPAQSPSVIQRNATLTVPAGTYGMATASCATGETMVSGGWSTTAVLPADSLGMLASYPSDSTGAPPLTQGQAETSWTVRATNPSTTPVTYTVSVDCLVGLGSSVTNGVWFQSAQSGTCTNCVGNQASIQLQCPDWTSALAGGGFDYQPFGQEYKGQPYVIASLGEVGPSVGWFWNVEWWLGRGTGYAVCVTAPTIAPMPYVVAHATTVNEMSAGQYQADVVVSCPQTELLVGGGFINASAGVAGELPESPLTTDAFVPGTSPAWNVGFDVTGTPGLWAYPFGPDDVGQCIEITPPPHIHFTFSNVHHLLRIPADVVVATDGSGQLKATLVNASVTQVQSAPINAVQTTNPFTGGVTYSVPGGCGDPSPAIAAATATLTAQLKRAVPAGQVAFGSPSVSINRGSLTCSPAAGTQRAAPFTYTQAIDGRASQGTYTPGAVFSYQLQQLQAAARQLGSPYVLGNTLVCPSGPSLQSATATRATIACAADGVAEWPWSGQALRALAAQLAGKTPSQALAFLNGTPGVEPGSASIALPAGVTITTLPTKPDQIALFVAITQDTAPVVRTP